MISLFRDMNSSPSNIVPCYTYKILLYNILKLRIVFKCYFEHLPLIRFQNSSRFFKSHPMLLFSSVENLTAI